MIQNSNGGASDPVENHDKPGIRGVPCGYWAGRWDQLGWADRLMQQCRLAEQRGWRRGVGPVLARPAS